MFAGTVLLMCPRAIRFSLISPPMENSAAPGDLKASPWGSWSQLNVPSQEWLANDYLKPWLVKARQVMAMSHVYLEIFFFKSRLS